MTATLSEGARAPARGERSFFYVWMAITCAVVAFVGFAPTYWAPMAQGSFAGSPVVHLHGAIFFTWTLFVIYQTWLVATGKTAIHREVGLIGVALATAMVIFGIMTAIKAVVRAENTQFFDAAKQFMIVPVTGIVLFGVLVVFAIANVRRQEWHKRLLLVATISILEAAIARWFLTFLAPPLAPGEVRSPVPPVEATFGPALVATLILLVAVIYDWRKRGRPHPAYLIGGGAVVLLEIVRLPLSKTAAWDSVAQWLLTFAG